MDKSLLLSYTVLNDRQKKPNHNKLKFLVSKLLSEQIDCILCSTNKIVARSIFKSRITSSVSVGIFSWRFPLEKIKTRWSEMDFTEQTHCSYLLPFITVLFAQWLILYFHRRAVNSCNVFANVIYMVFRAYWGEKGKSVSGVITGRFACGGHKIVLRNVSLINVPSVDRNSQLLITFLIPIAWRPHVCGHLSWTRISQYYVTVFPLIQDVW